MRKQARPLCTLDNYHSQLPKSGPLGLAGAAGMEHFWKLWVSGGTGSAAQTNSPGHHLPGATKGSRCPAPDSSRTGLPLWAQLLEAPRGSACICQPIYTKWVWAHSLSWTLIPLLLLSIFHPSQAPIYVCPLSGPQSSTYSFPLLLPPPELNPASSRKPPGIAPPKANLSLPGLSEVSERESVCIYVHVHKNVTWPTQLWTW